MHISGWMEANIAFMRSGGYSVSHRIKEVTVPTLVLWGRNDEILDAKFAEKFPQELPESRVVFVERCGHSPHLEQAGIVGGIILDSVLPLLEEGIPPSGEDSDELRKEEVVLSSLI
jgi:pimeloyl-ACP methyl ester carboxylesterase